MRSKVTDRLDIPTKHWYIFGNCLHYIGTALYFLLCYLSTRIRWLHYSCIILQENILGKLSLVMMCELAVQTGSYFPASSFVEYHWGALL